MGILDDAGNLVSVHLGEVQQQADPAAVTDVGRHEEALRAPTALLPIDKHPPISA